MRAIHCLLLSCILIAGCSAPVASPTPELLPRFTPDEPAIPPAQPGLEPVSTAKKLLETNGDFHWIDPPTAYAVQQLTIVEAHKLIPMLSPEVDQAWGTQTGVYLVAFRGRWEVGAIDSGQTNPAPVPYKGCLFALFTAADGQLIAAGETPCPGQQ